MLATTLQRAAQASSGHEVSGRKQNGVHYTPPELAAFLARRTLAALPTSTRTAAVLDPACGEGELLLAVAEAASAYGLELPRLVGVDQDPDALSLAERRFATAGIERVELVPADFLDASARVDSLEPSPIAAEYDVIISNPPYVRTQVLGSSAARKLADRFDLSGRVDLYQAFVAAMTLHLRPGGVLGLLCSNRFLSTQSGRSLRSLLAHNFEIEELWDLGDTKLFEAAVLPAIVIARRSKTLEKSSRRFVRVYEADQAEKSGISEGAFPDILAALESDVEGLVRAGSRSFTVERGLLVQQSDDAPWRLGSATTSAWLKTVEEHSAGKLGDLGPIRVGIKTTADSVFIRERWDDLPKAEYPEPELLRPLLTHRVAQQWRANSTNPGSTRTVLYTHVTSDGRRAPVNLQHFPNARRYLERNRTQLEGRTYVLKAGRNWYEIWVPQQPDGWDAPKIVWPDISEHPRFFLDDSGAVVNGDCYWLSCDGLPDETIALALAVANSTFAVRFYDVLCGNRLYSGRRRFITQYVRLLPVPTVGPAESAEILGLTARLLERDVPDAERAATAGALDNLVWQLFGVEKV